MATRRQVSIFINGKEVAGNIKAIRSEKAKLNRELNLLTIGTKEYNAKAADINKLDKVIADHRKRLRGVSSTWDKLKGVASGFIGVTAAAFTAQAIVDYGSRLFELGTEMEVLGRKAKTVFAETLPQVTQAAEENANAMGLTVGQYIDAAAAIGDLLVPMGFQREEAANISTELVNLSGALSEWTGGQIKAEDVTKILGKAVLGEREELKQLGISINEADVKARLAEKGLSSLTGEMLQQAKAAATLELITEKSGDAQAAFAANSDTLVRRQAELRASFQDINESLATALIPVFQRLLEVAEPVVKNVVEFIKALVAGEQPTGKFAGLIGFLVTRLQNLGKFGNFVLQIFGKLVDFLLNNFGGVIQFVGVKLVQLNNLVTKVLNGLSKVLKIKIEFNEIDVQAFKDGFEAIREARKSSKVDEPITIEPPTETPTNQNRPTGNLSPTPDELAERQKRADDLQKQREKDAEREAKRQEQEAQRQLDALQKQLEKLQEVTGQFQEEAKLAELDEDAQAIERLRQRYATRIEEAKSLEESGNAEIAEAALAQRLELEQLQAEAIRLLKAEQNEEDRIQREEFKIALQEELADEFELQLLQLEEHYTNLKNQAEIFGIDTSAITKKYEEERTKIQAEQEKKRAADADKARKERLAKMQAEAKAIGQAFGGISDVIGAALQVAGEEGSKFSKFSKGLALAQLAFKTAEALANGIASASSLPFPGNLVAIATTVATIVGNVASARKVLNEGKVPQRKRGGYVQVRGQDDGLLYNAQYIGRPTTGMLPDHPVLLDTVGGRVLGSEAGAEYFVNHQEMKKPAVLAHVRAIDNIARARQFQEGGATAPLPNLPPTAQPTATVPAELTGLLVDVRNLLTDLQQNGVEAYISDDTAVAMQKRLNQLASAGGGTIT